ncbi:hypothetical protein C8Q73DRAFT_662426 [Cubamyces lactineus]|nr:hypothetical protein C8Q73DRAFT_662426 [Cubamyces lactineus]
MSGLPLRTGSHIGRLPPELLTHIFAGLRDDSVRFEWLQITAVCKYWREVAIGYHRLWAKIQIPSGFDVEVVEAVLSRSKQAPLKASVACQDHDSDLDDALRLLIPHANRLECLSLTIEMTQCFIVETHLQKLGPALRKLHLKGIIPDVDRASLPFLDHVSLLGVELPRLTSLHLDGILVDAPDSLLAQLGRISLRKIEPALSRLDRGVRALLFPDYMRDTLAACVNAESVCLEEAFDRESVLAWEPVHLPKLRRLYILDMCFGTRKILRLFSLPPTTAVHVTSVPERSLTPRDTLSRGCFTTALPTRDHDQTTQLRREGTRKMAFHASDASWRVKGLVQESAGRHETRPATRPATPWSASVVFPEALDKKTREAHLCSALHELGSLVYPGLIKKLEIHVAPHLGHDYPWISLLREFSSLRSLTVGGVSAITTLLDAVASAAKDPGEEPLARISVLKLCLPDVTPALGAASRRCVDAQQATSLSILSRNVTLHLPPDRKGDGEVTQRIVTGWLREMAIAFPCVRWKYEMAQCRVCQGITP